MKKNYILITIAIILIATTQISAKVWRVNNTYLASADFTSISTAISNSSVLAGDTLYVEGSALSYGTITLNKRLVILGTGYFISDNDSTQAHSYPSTLDKITFNSGAQGSFIAGLYITGTYYTTSTLSSSASVVGINTNDITISNCFVENTYNSSYNDAAIFIASGVNNIIIKKCFLRTVRTSYTSSYVIYLAGTNTNIYIYNNIIKQNTKSSGAGYSVYMTSSCEAIIGNNVLIGNNFVYNSVVFNNIQIRGTFTNSPIYFNTMQNNIGNASQFGTIDGNQSISNMATIFTYAPSGENIDNHYRLLQPSSPAIAAGLNGTDCGIFGGNDPYKLSGLPAIPAIFNANIPVGGTTTGGINIDIKGKSHQ